MIPTADTVAGHTVPQTQQWPPAVVLRVACYRDIDTLVEPGLCDATAWHCLIPPACRHSPPFYLRVFSNATTFGTYVASVANLLPRYRLTTRRYRGSPAFLRLAVPCSWRVFSLDNGYTVNGRYNVAIADITGLAALPYLAVRMRPGITDARHALPDTEQADMAVYDAAVRTDIVRYRTTVTAPVTAANRTTTPPAAHHACRPGSLPA